MTESDDKDKKVVPITRKTMKGAKMNYKNVSPIKPEWHQEILVMKMEGKTLEEIKNHLEKNRLPPDSGTSITALSLLIKSLNKESLEVAATVVADKVRETIQSDWG